jgi:hypothetical protein
MMDGTDAPAARDPLGRFAAGNPGKPLGSRNRISKRVARAILRDFEAHQHELLPRLRRWHAPLYVTLVSRLLPRTCESGGVELDEPMGEAEMARMVARMRSALDLAEAGGGLEALEAAWLGEGRHNSGAVSNGDLR